MYAYVHVYLLHIERPSADVADPNPEPPNRLQVMGFPGHQPRDQSIVQAHSVQTVGVVGHVPEGSLGFSRCPLWGSSCPGHPWGLPGASLVDPKGVPERSLAGPGASRGPEGVPRRS